ncbi:thioredoxin family protein [candidate division KSB1 bacterium]|nr:thioredoxin family protein [candidate division KSB1 bacterium]NIR71537.1 thioredoxin family protein [candidate division KSB1 bacterium]NIS26333.1 thioredoxin family protein [candidate division KSB1 bacterium]NIT73100.1 thioredoxin family protein [candidate division KSB1 bacterium]NIU27016.1 thioredoxin family protein [candidate division KSB1 bacterium]
MEIRVLGPSCRACDKVYRDTKTVLAELGKAADLEHIRDLKEIGRYGMMATPALIVNGKVKSSGKIPSKKQLKKWLEEA